MIQAMQAEGLKWGEGYRPLARRAIAEIIESRMREAVDAHLESAWPSWRWLTAGMAVIRAIC
jgi:hypothetical protein